MNTQVKRDILAVLQDAKKYLIKHDEQKLKDVSDQIIHSASIYQDDYTTSTAVAIYSLGKMLIAIKTHPEEAGVFIHEVSKTLTKLINFLENDDLKSFENLMASLFRKIAGVDTQFGKYIEWVINYSKMKKGSKLYEHGISQGRVADLLGISQWELQKYMGTTRANEYPGTKTKSVNDRLKLMKKKLGGNT